MAGRPATREAPPFGQRLAAARKSRGLSQMRLAEQMGVSRKLIDYYERRAQNPTLDFIERVAEALGISTGELLGSPGPRAGKQPGPTPRLLERFERVRKLPRKEQEFILRFLDTVLDGTDKAS